MRSVTVSILLAFNFFSVEAQPEHELWLQNRTAAPVNIICAKISPTLAIARQELQRGWLGKPNATVTLKK